jgi:queuine tRNA-ribosyltransferase
MRNARHEADPGPIEPGCDCPACTQFSRGAIRHFFQVGEMLGPILVSLHNVRFFARLMGRIREAVAAGRFAALEKELLKSVESVD